MCSKKREKENESVFAYFPDLQYVFTSRTDFLKFATRAADGNCPYCIKSIQATEIHLMKRHYQNSVHFIEDGTGTSLLKVEIKM